MENHVAVKMPTHHTVILYAHFCLVGHALVLNHWLRLSVIVCVLK